MSLVINNVSIHIREIDGFINATELCKAGRKKSKTFSQWNRLDSTKELIENLQNDLEVEVVDVKVGGNHSGSWIHPRLVVPLATQLDKFPVCH